MVWCADRVGSGEFTYDGPLGAGNDVVRSVNYFSHTIPYHGAELDEIRVQPSRLFHYYMRSASVIYFTCQSVFLLKWYVMVR